MATISSHSSIQGVEAIELMPSFGTLSVRKRLTQSIIAAESLRSAIAFWTIDINFLGQALPALLRQSHSFMCVDIHRPTDIDKLAQLASQGANMFLHLWQLKPQRGFNIPGLPPHLLHSKILLFDLPDDKAELWVGSHNWTQRAISGPNIESSLLLRLDNSSLIYSQAALLLDDIRDNLCTRLDPNRLEYYKRLQGSKDEEQAWVIELEGQDVNRLEGTSITIFGTDEADLTHMKIVGGQLVVSLTDSSTFEQHNYDAIILQSGQLRAANPAAGGITFDARRFAFRYQRTLAVLEPEIQPDVSVLNSSRYFVTVQLREYLGGNVRILEPPVEVY